MMTDVLPTGERTHQLLAMHARPRPASALSSVLTLAWRAMLKIKHVPFQLFDVTVMPIMFTLLFTYIFGGALAGDVFRYSFATVLIVVMGLILGFRPQGGALGVLSAVGLVLIFCFAISWLWIIVGMLVRTPESVMTTSFVFLMPLTFMSDIFVNLETMPGWLQEVVGRNPVTLLARASRGLMHGEPGAGADVISVLVASAAIVLVAAPIAMRLYRKER